MGLRDRALAAAARVHSWAGDVLLAAKRASGLLRPLRVQVYRGHGTPDEVYLKGRVREETGVSAATGSDTAWQNLANMARRFVAAPIPGADLVVRLPGDGREVSTDREGYFRVTLRPASPLPAGWHDVDVELLRPLGPGQDDERAVGQVLVPAGNVDFAVISDLDDTVLRTGLSNLLLAARLVLLNNARTRTPFHGVAAFYAALQAGPDGDGANPLFYVSSSPWNLYDLLVEFLDVHGIPPGPTFLRPWGLDADSLPGGGHAGHKSVRIDRLLATYPSLPFVLIGDSGQEDPEIYRDVALAAPHRVRAIYIRDVTTPERDRAVHAVAEQVRAAGVDFLLVPDTAAAARHAADHGLVMPARVPAVAGAAARDRASARADR